MKYKREPIIQKQVEHILSTQRWELKSDQEQTNETKHARKDMHADPGESHKNYTEERKKNKIRKREKGGGGEGKEKTHSQRPCVTRNTCLGSSSVQVNSEERGGRVRKGLEKGGKEARRVVKGQGEAQMTCQRAEGGDGMVEGGCRCEREDMIK